MSIAPVPADLEICDDRDVEYNPELASNDAHIFHRIFDDGENIGEVVIPNFKVDGIVYKAKAVSSDSPLTKFSRNMVHG